MIKNKGQHKLQGRPIKNRSSAKPALYITLFNIGVEHREGPKNKKNKISYEHSSATGKWHSALNLIIVALRTWLAIIL